MMVIGEINRSIPLTRDVSFLPFLVKNFTWLSEQAYSAYDSTMYVAAQF